MDHERIKAPVRHARLALALALALGLISTGLPATAAEQGQTFRSTNGRTAPQLTAAMKQTLSRVTVSSASTRRNELAADSARSSQVNSAIAAAARAARAARAAACN
ncbi:MULTISPECIES: hypothetical protein [Achromobacter]|uniref:hypothetical protein n=1 Tax=Achromobacter TaxID=222 RepID=UPI0023F740F0|nr:hypothetical protein [Achromobacter anxifer]MDF8364670.1 hypothetical protein [Achromobacter anxifer]